MNLSTHTAYPDVVVGDHNTFDLRFFDISGNVVFSYFGAGRDSGDVTRRVREIIEQNEGDFLIGGES